MRISTVVKMEAMFVERLKSIYSMAHISMYSHEQLITKTLEVKSSEDFNRCPRHVREFVRGYDRAMYDSLWNIMVSCYINLKTNTIYYGAYPKKLYQTITFLGHAWPNSPDNDTKFYSRRSQEELFEEKKKRGIR